MFIVCFEGSRFPSQNKELEMEMQEMERVKLFPTGFMIYDEKILLPKSQNPYKYQ